MHIKSLALSAIIEILLKDQKASATIDWHSAWHSTFNANIYNRAKHAHTFLDFIHVQFLSKEDCLIRDSLMVAIKHLKKVISVSRIPSVELSNIPASYEICDRPSYFMGY